VAVTRQKRPLAFQGTVFQFVRLMPHMFFGYRRETLAGLSLTVADEAKAILDSLYLPGNAGGLTEVAKSLRAALLDDELSISVAVKERRAASILFGQTIDRVDGTCLVRASVRVACVDVRRMRPVPMPADLFAESTP